MYPSFLISVNWSGISYNIYRATASSATSVYMSLSLYSVELKKLRLSNFLFFKWLSSFSNVVNGPSPSPTTTIDSAYYEASMIA